jgi:MoaA/NifB/PqqE/SkfB family radical SAM enzyme
MEDSMLYKRMNFIMKIPIMYIKKKLALSTFPWYIVISFTERCNSRCRTCLIWKYGKRNTRDELTIDEWKKVIQQLKQKVFIFGIMGGEPFIRKEVDRFLELICNVNPVIVTISTNGILTERIISILDRISRKFPRIEFYVNISIDEIGKRNDKIRGIKDAFEKSMKTVKELKNLNRKNLHIGVNSVLSIFNQNNFLNLYRFFSSQNIPWIFEVAETRKNLLNKELKVSPKGFMIKSVLQEIIDNEKRKKQDIVRILRTLFYERLYFKIPMKCWVPFFYCYIDSTGNIFLCPNRGIKVGNLKEYNYSLKDVLLNTKTQTERKRLEKCNFCYLASAFYVNFLFSPYFLFKFLSRIT